MAEDRDKAQTKGRAYEYRIGKKSLSVWVKPEMIFALKIVAAEQQKQQQEAIVEALNDYLEKNGKPRIE